MSTHVRLTAALLVTALAVGACAPSAASPSTGAPPTPSPASPAPTAAPGATATPSASASPDPVAAARADLEKLTTFMETRHPDLFRDMTEAVWRAAVNRLDALIPELVPGQPERLYVEFRRLVALPGVIGGRHGHTGAWPAEGTPMPGLAVVTYTFADGLFITRATPDQQDLIGSRIVSVGGRPIDEVRALLDPLMVRDNQWTPEIWLGDYLWSPAVLVGLGIVDAVGPVEVALQRPNGKVRSVEIPLESGQALVPSQPPIAWAGADFTSWYYLPERPGALWTSRMDEALWWTTLHDGATLYVQMNLFEPPPASLLDGILEAARKPAVERVILDLRHNMGGDDDGGMLRTFQDEAIDQPGRLFVITSTNVFSATPPFVSALDRRTYAVLVGEPIGGSPTAFGYGASVTLDRLPIPLMVEMPQEPLGGEDLRLTIEPDIPVPLLGTDYFGDRDAALEAILSAAS